MMTAEELLEIAKTWVSPEEKDETSFWLESINPVPATEQDYLALLDKCPARFQNTTVQELQATPTLALELWCNKAKALTDSREPPTREFLQTLLRIIDASAIKRNHQRVTTVFWRASRLQGMFCELGSSSWRSLNCRKGWDSFTSHLLGYASWNGFLPSWEPMLKLRNADRNGYYNAINFIRSEICRQPAGGDHWMKGVPDFQHQTLERVMNSGTDQEKEIMRYACWHKLREAKQRTVDTIDQRLAVLRPIHDFLVFLGDKTLATRWRQKASPEPAWLPDPLEALSQLELARKAKAKAPGSLKRKVFYFQETKWIASLR